MKRLVVMMAAATLLICSAPYGRTESVPNKSKKDKMEAAKTAEIKGDVARIRDDYALAAAYYQTAIRVKRQDAELYNKLGIAELKLNQRGAARKYFGLAVKYDPRLVPALNNLGAVALLEKKYKAAANYFKQALAMDESNAHIHINLAEAWLGLGEVDHAMTEYARALELDADVLSANQDGVQAQVNTPGQSARISYMIAKAYMKRGNIEGALDYLRRAKDLHYTELASVYADQDFSPLWQDPRLAKIVKR
ncbi:MAG: tetratricopeptide repeat protein [Terracidiphilus sp.]|jgi:tetratricopeptide (TPR) repeat protein